MAASTLPVPSYGCQGVLLTIVWAELAGGTPPRIGMHHWTDDAPGLQNSDWMVDFLNRHLAAQATVERVSVLNGYVPQVRSRIRAPGVQFYELTDPTMPAVSRIFSLACTRPALVWHRC